MYCALTVDLKHSRRYDNQARLELQEYLVQSMELLNQIFADSLEKKLRFSGGDELQGLFSGVDAAILCFRLLRRMVFPAELHAGFGMGEWNVRILDRDTFYQDGSAYHRAREAVEQAKRDTDRDVVFLSGDPMMDGMRDALLNGALRLTAGNTVYQNELAVLLECLYPIPPRGRLWAIPLHKIPALMERRYELMFYQKGFSKSRKSPLMYGCINDQDAEKAFIRECKQQEAGQEGTWAHPRGAASEVAKAANLTRQAVDTALKSANVYHERALILALMKLSKNRETEKGGL